MSMFDQFLHCIDHVNSFNFHESPTLFTPIFQVWKLIRDSNPGSLSAGCYPCGTAWRSRTSGEVTGVTSGWETLGLVELLCILTDVLVTGLNAFVRTWRVVQKWMSFKLCKLYLNEIFFSPGGGNGNSLQYSCLGNPMDRGPWWATVHGVTKKTNMT